MVVQPLPNSDAFFGDAEQSVDAIDRWVVESSIEQQFDAIDQALETLEVNEPDCPRESAAPTRLRLPAILAHCRRAAVAATNR